MGFPYGLTEAEFRKSSAEADREAGWARAKRILEAVVRQFARRRAKVDVGCVNKVGQGLSRDVFAAAVEIATPTRRDELELTVLLPRRGCDGDLDARALKEVRLLGHLETLDLPFRTPRAYGVHPDGHHLALVRSFERGVPLDLRAGRSAGAEPWRLVGEIAAATHRVSVASCPGLERRHATRRDHARAAIRELAELAEPEAVDAHAWAQAHLPPPTPSVLLHGDLLGQNILLGIDEPNAVIDWEYAELGDPAYDLAIVTRGARRPFQIDDGVERLLDAYARAGGAELTRAHVQVHELALAAHWYRSASTADEHQRTQSLQLLRNVLRRAIGSR